MSNALNHYGVRSIAGAFRLADHVARTKLSATGLIKDEREYVAIMLNHVFDWSVDAGLRSVLRAEPLSSGESTRTGTDALVVVQVGRTAKVGLFEAKRTRRGFDWPQKGISHFTSQLNRQDPCAGAAWIWEQFIVGHPEDPPLPPEYDRLGSTCVWHAVAKLYLASSALGQRLWKLDDVQRLVALEDMVTLRADFGSERNIADMVSRMLLPPPPGGTTPHPLGHDFPLGPGSLGGPSPGTIAIGDDGFANLRSFNGSEEPLRIPCSIPATDADSIGSFCRQHGFSVYFLLDATPAMA